MTNTRFVRKLIVICQFPLSFANLFSYIQWSRCGVSRLHVIETSIWFLIIFLHVPNNRYTLPYTLAGDLENAETRKAQHTTEIISEKKNNGKRTQNNRINSIHKCTLNTRFAIRTPYYFAPPPLLLAPLSPHHIQSHTCTLSELSTQAKPNIIFNTCTTHQPTAITKAGQKKNEKKKLRAKRLASHQHQQQHHHRHHLTRINIHMRK